MAYYDGQKGALRYIADLLDNYDGCNTIASLKELIDEARQEAIKGIIEKDGYKV